MSAASIPPALYAPGEPAGIGLDLAVLLACRPAIQPVLVIADQEALEARADLLGERIKIEHVDEDDCFSALRPAPAGVIKLLSAPLCVSVNPGVPDENNASCVLDALRRAVGLCLSQAGAACGAFLLTGPVHKGVINASGERFSGQTEFIARCAERVSGRRCAPLMMLTCPGLRVALATTHLPLRAVADCITRDLLRERLLTLHGELRRRWGIEAPRIAVCGLNPHAGEGGALGFEELEIIAPCLDSLRAEGLSIEGPLAADSAFSSLHRADYDAFLAMFHDQGLTPLKALGFGSAVNITLGLPLLRVSVDHGTALELAGRPGCVDQGSLRAALDCAQQLSASGLRRSEELLPSPASLAW